MAQRHSRCISRTHLVVRHLHVLHEGSLTHVRPAPVHAAGSAFAPPLRATVVCHIAIAIAVAQFRIQFYRNMSWGCDMGPEIPQSTRGRKLHG